MSVSEPAREPFHPVEPDSAPQPESAASKLFDLRLLIGGLFVFYGAVLIVAGLLASSAELHKAAGININLWMGIGMLVVGALFLLWRQLQPTQPRPKPAPDSMQPEPPRQLHDRAKAPRRG